MQSYVVFFLQKKNDAVSPGNMLRVAASLETA